MMQNRAWIVAGILYKQVVCGFMVFAENGAGAYRKAFGVLSRIEQVRVENGEMKLVVEEITNFDQVFSLETSYGKARWLADGR